jgi:hypothetical protein
VGPLDAALLVDALAISSADRPETKFTSLLHSILLAAPAFPAASKKRPAHIAGPAYIQFCRNLLRASLADHLHVGHAQIADRVFA